MAEPPRKRPCFANRQAVQGVLDHNGSFQDQILKLRQALEEEEHRSEVTRKAAVAKDTFIINEFDDHGQVVRELWGNMESLESENTDNTLFKPRPYKV